MGGVDSCDGRGLLIVDSPLSIPSLVLLTASLPLNCLYHALSFRILVLSKPYIQLSIRNLPYNSYLAIPHSDTSHPQYLFIRTDPYLTPSSKKTLVCTNMESFALLINV